MKIVKKFKVWQASRKSVTYRGWSITIGSFIENTGQQFVALTLVDRSACLTTEGARLVAKQIAEWADRADAHNAELGIQLRYAFIKEATKILKQDKQP